MQCRKILQEIVPPNCPNLVKVINLGLGKSKLWTGQLQRKPDPATSLKKAENQRLKLNKFEAAKEKQTITFKETTRRTVCFSPEMRD